MREIYLLSDEELKSLIFVVKNYKDSDIYDIVKNRFVEYVKSNQKDIDNICMDIHDTILDMAKNNLYNESEILYDLSFIFRKIAHEVHTMYIQQGKPKAGGRFLELIK